MSKRYQHESEIRALVESFENATIDRGDWKHAEHLSVALYCLNRHDYETAYGKMRSGIFKLLCDAFAVELTTEVPYHETLTVFWMRTVAEFNNSRNGDSLLDETNELIANYDKDYPLLFYSRELLFSDDARAGFVEGDL